MPRWFTLDKALELIGHDQQEALRRACYDGRVRWEVRDERGDLLSVPPWHWASGRVDWTTSPPRFAMEEPDYTPLIVSERGGGRFTPPPSPPPVWCVAEVEEQSLLGHFGIREPLEVRIVEPVSVRIVEWLAGLVGLPKGAARAATRTQDLATDAALEELFKREAAERGRLPDQNEAFDLVRKHFGNRCPKRDAIREVIASMAGRKRGRPTTR